MTKKGTIKIGLFSLAIMSFLFILNIIFISEKSFATTSENIYELGERVKLDLTAFQDYKLKIITPSEPLIYRGNQNVFIFKPLEIGDHSILVESLSGDYSYSFKVIASAIKGNLSNESTFKNNLNNYSNYSSNQNSEFNFSIPEEDSENLEDSLIERIPSNLEVFSSNEAPKFFFSSEEVHSAQVVSPTLIDSLTEVFSSYQPQIYIEDIYKNSFLIDKPIYSLDESLNVGLIETRHITPGLNKLVVEFYHDEKKYLLERWFLWGILAANLDKSIYLPKDKVHISLGVLSETGVIICDADLNIKIESPNGVINYLSTNDGNILKSNKSKIV